MRMNVTPNRPTNESRGGFTLLATGFLLSHPPHSLKRSCFGELASRNR
jgi:hypothetical protein